MPRWAHFSRFAVFTALAVGGCLVSFEDYPVGNLNPDGVPSGGNAGAAGTSGGSGGSAAVDASVGGSSTGGSSTGGSSTGGSLGGAGSAGTTSGAGGTPSDAGVDSPSDAVSPCGDTTSSKANCGRCGHDCCGGDCVAGKCKPDEIYAGPDGGNEAPEEVAAYGAYVYFSSTRISGVRRVPISGGPGEPFWNTRQRVTSLAADASGVYVAATNEDAGSSGLVERVPLAGGPSQVILDMDDYPSEIALDESYVYWRSGNSVINRWRKTDGNPGPIGAPITGLGRFTALSGQVYYHLPVGGRIMRRDGGGVNQDAQLAMGEAGVSSMAANGSYVFWALAAGKIRRVAVAGGGVIDLADTGANPTWSAADDSHVYWLTFGSPIGALRAARVEAAGTAIDLATELDRPRKLALDARCIYVTTAGVPGKILRVAKP